MNKEVNKLEYQIPFSQKEYVQALIRSHFREADLPECLKIEGELSLSNLMARAWYRPEQDGKILTVMSLGRIFDDLIESYEKKEELLLAYAAECLAMEVLKKAYEMFGRMLYEKEGKYPETYHFLNDKEMRNMPEILEQMGIREICCNEAFALVPQKTVVFLTELSDRANKECAKPCVNCSRKNCPNRTKETEQNPAALNYGYQRIFGSGGKQEWKKD